MVLRDRPQTTEWKANKNIHGCDLGHDCNVSVLIVLAEVQMMII